MPFFPSIERLCPDRLHDYEVQLIDGARDVLSAPNNHRPIRLGHPRWGVELLGGGYSSSVSVRPPLP